MAQSKIYEPAGALEVEANKSYDYTNIPVGCTIVELQMGERLYDSKNDKTPLRGVRMTITNNLTEGANPKPNIPFIWLEGTMLKFNQNYTYKFQNNGIVGYGKEIDI